MYAPHIVPPPEGRVAPGTSTVSILAPPGTYTVQLTAAGVTETQPLVVRKDPTSGGSEGDIAAQTRALVAIRDDLRTAADAVHRIELVRVQLDTIARGARDGAVRNAAGSLQQRLVELEMHLVDLRLTGRGQDGVRFGAKLVSKLGYLANGIASSDYKPTNQHEEVRRLLGGELRTRVASLDALLATALAALNELLRQRGLPGVVVRRGATISE
jgi:hypothetical protein